MQRFIAQDVKTAKAFGPLPIHHPSLKSELGKPNSTDHQRAGNRKQQDQRMKREAGKHDPSKPEGLAQCALEGGPEHYQHQQQ
jgi:hypothetical protein